MDAQKIDMFIMMHSKELPPSKLPYIRQQLMMVDESKWGQRIFPVGGGVS